jgi:hypothetical protein
VTAVPGDGASHAPRDDLSVEVLDDLARPGPLLRRDDEIDVTTPEPIGWLVGDATGINIHLAEPVAPCHGGGLLLERADRLPALEARIADRYRGLFCLGGLPETG